MRIIGLLAVSAFAVTLLSACNNEKAQVQLHEPGKYQGKAVTMKVDEEAIKKRFAMIQKDR